MLSSSEYDTNQHSGTSGSKLRVTNFSYSVSSEEKGHRENMSLRLKWAPIFCVRRCRDIYGCVSTKKAKQLMTAKNIIGATCTKSGSYYSYITVVYEGNTVVDLYVEFSMRGVEKEFSTIDVGQFLVQYLNDTINLYHTRKQISKMVKVFGCKYPSIVQKIEAAKKIKGKHSSKNCQLTEAEEELKGWLGAEKHHRQSLDKISCFLFS